MYVSAYFEFSRVPCKNHDEINEGQQYGAWLIVFSLVFTTNDQPLSFDGPWTSDFRLILASSISVLERCPCVWIFHCGIQRAENKGYTSVWSWCFIIIKERSLTNRFYWLSMRRPQLVWNHSGMKGPNRGIIFHTNEMRVELKRS